MNNIRIAVGGYDFRPTEWSWVDGETGNYGFIRWQGGESVEVTAMAGDAPSLSTAGLQAAITGLAHILATMQSIQALGLNAQAAEDES